MSVHEVARASLRRLSFTLSCNKLIMVRHVGGHGLRDTPAKGRRGTHGVDAEDQEAGADPCPYTDSKKLK